MRVFTGIIVNEKKNIFHKNTDENFFSGTDKTKIIPAAPECMHYRMETTGQGAFKII